MLTELKRWVREHTPLDQPQIAEIQIVGVLDDFGPVSSIGPTQLLLLDVPQILPNLFIRLTAELSENMVLKQPDIVSPHILVPRRLTHIISFPVVLPAPLVTEIPLTWFWVEPEVLDLFTILATPGRAGKVYNELQQSINDTPGAEPQTTIAEAFCPHALRRRECAICLDEEKQRLERTRFEQERHKKGRTVDVFDLLLPHLQPPIESLLAAPLLFPPNRRPYDYQIKGVQFLAERKAALLGDEMGLGKTIQTIVALQLLFRKGEIRRVLIICPRSLLGTWQRELERWAPELYVHKVRGTRDERKHLWHLQASVYLTTYETFREDAKELGNLSSKFELAVLDEIQRIKNPMTKISQAVRRVQTRYRWGLSGTPLENKTEDIVAIFEYLQPHLFNKVSNQLSPQYIKERIKPYFLRRRTQDVRAELPEKVTNEVWLELTDDQRYSYDLLFAKARQALSNENTSRIHIFTLINKLKLICNLDPATGRSCKVDYLVDQLESITSNNQKALIFSHFPKATLSQIEEQLKEYNPAIFDGSLSDRQREALLQSFTDGERPRILLMSVIAGGVGLTLTRANHVFHFDHWWNPAVARQAEARAHRIGQEETVFVYDIFTRDTIEERIYRILAAKQHLFDQVIDDLTDEYIKGTISDEELFGLFDLKPPPSKVKAANWQALSPTEFEKVVARLYDAMGFLTVMTSASHDRGVDIFARRLNDVGMENLIIQCKHYPNRTVGTPVIRDMIGTWQDHRNATRSVIVTSGSFSSGAVQLANKHRVDLVDRLSLEQLLKTHNVSIDKPPIP